MATDDLVLITGASGGLGVALTEHLLSAGWTNLVCQYRSRPERIAAVLSAAGLDPCERLLQADLTEEPQLGALHEAIRQSFGPVFGLVNLAGASSNGMSWKLSREQFQRVLDDNLLSAFLTCREFTPEMRERQRGRIVNVSSVVAYTGVAGAAHYAAAKAAVVGFSKSLALELAPKQIAVSIVALGYLNYGLIHSVPPEQQEQIKARIPARRFGAREELGGLITYLLSEAGAYAGGQVFHLNGGLYS
jgi:NAD(P)-dependent dehydrogenase (short-subunit alcohol dehydrogenase family)